MTTLSFTDPPATIRPADCLEDRKLRLDMALNDFQGNATLELWTAPDGVDCRSSADRSACTKLAAVPLSLSTSAEFSARSLALCGDAGVTASSLQALYFEPGQSDTASVSANVTIRFETADGGAASTEPPPANDGDDGCSATGCPCDGSMILMATALCAIVRRRKARARF